MRSSQRFTGRAKINAKNTNLWRLVIIRESRWKFPGHEAELLTTKHQFRLVTFCCWRE